MSEYYLVVMSLHFVTQGTLLVSNDHVLQYKVIRLIVLVVNNNAD